MAKGGLELGLAVANWLRGPGGVDDDNKPRRMNALFWGNDEMHSWFKTCCRLASS